MHKVIIYSISVFFLLAGCSTTAKLTDSRNIADVPKRDFYTYGDIEAAGLAGTGFFVRKANVEIQTEGTSEKLSLILRRNQEEEYLASVRSRTGIEGARVLLTRDTLVVNDRINRMLICGRPESLYRLYGFNSWMLPLVLGDVLAGDSSAAKIACKDNAVELKIRRGKNLISYLIDCKDYRTERTVVSDLYGPGEIKVEFGRFRQYGAFSFPEDITLSDKAGRYVVSVSFEDVEIPWKGDIVFIPGEKFERIELK